MVVFICEIELQIYLEGNHNQLRDLEILIDDAPISHSSLFPDRIKYNVNVVWEREKILKLTIRYKFVNNDVIYKVDMDIKLKSYYEQKFFNDFVIKNGDLYLIR